jgi:hypothetical protein
MDVDQMASGQLPGNSSDVVLQARQFLMQDHVRWCTTCKAVDAVFSYSAPPGKPGSCRLCHGCYPKDEHGNHLCIVCRGLQCAECQMCGCSPNADITVCDCCKLPFCNVRCERRGDCREDGNSWHDKHYDRGCETGTGLEAGVDCNAPLGLGCQCSCCKRLRPPVCTMCVRKGSPCEDCFGQWESLEEDGDSVCSTSKYAMWREHWSGWIAARTVV